MRKTLFVVPLCSLALVFLLALPSFSATVQCNVLHSRDRYPLQGEYPLAIQLKIAKGWYIHSPHEEGDLISTRLSFESSQRVRLEKIRFPDPERIRFQYAPEPIDVYAGDVTVQATLVVEGDAPAGDVSLQGLLTYQACSSTTCLPPEKVLVHVLLAIVPQGAPSQAINLSSFSVASAAREEGAPWSRPGAGLWLTLLGLFLGGLALNLTPCIYPLIPITVSYFGGQRRKTSAHALLHGVLYISGLALTNSLLGLSAALSGGMLGSALQNPAVLVFVAGLLVALGLSFFGLWEFRIPSGLTRLASRNYEGYFGTFFMGLTLGVVAAPCLGPFILGLLTYVGQRGDPLLGFLYFFVLSIGMGLPLSILAVFSTAINKLPVSGDWMVWVRKLMGWVLIVMAAYLISPLLPQRLERFALIALVVMAAGVHLGWLDRAGQGSRRFQYLKKGVGLVFFLAGLTYLLWPTPETEGIRWSPYSEELLAAAVREKRPLILDFSADWCGPCQALEKKVFRDSEVAALSRGFVTLRMDLTHSQPSQDEVLKRYEVRGVPTVLFLTWDGAEVKDLRTESFVAKGAFLSKMKRLLDVSAGLEE